MNRAPHTLFSAACVIVFAAAAHSQTPTTSQPTSAPPDQAPAQTQTKPAASNNGAYISTDPLAGVRYDNRWDVSVGMAYGHIHAGPNQREGANLGGIDLSATYWLSKRLGVEASGRGYLGTSGTAPNADSLDGLFVSQYMFMAGPEYLGPHNKHGALVLHALVGGAYGDFNTDLRGNTAGPSGPAAFYTNQFALAGAFGGHIDLNRSPQWVFRITPDALLTTYDGTSIYPHTQWNFGISVGAQYKFKKKR